MHPDSTTVRWQKIGDLRYCFLIPPIVSITFEIDANSVSYPVIRVVYGVGQLYSASSIFGEMKYCKILPEVHLLINQSSEQEVQIIFPVWQPSPHVLAKALEVEKCLPPSQKPRYCDALIMWATATIPQSVAQRFWERFSNIQMATVEVCDADDFESGLPQVVQIFPIDNVHSHSPNFSKGGSRDNSHIP